MVSHECPSFGICVEDLYERIWIKYATEIGVSVADSWWGGYVVGYGYWDQKGVISRLMIRGFDVFP